MIFQLFAGFLSSLYNVAPFAHLIAGLRTIRRAPKGTI